MIAGVDRRRRQAAAANGDCHPGVDARRWLKLALLIKSVERWKTTGSQRDRFHSKGAHEQAVIGLPLRIEPGKELLASCYIDLVLKVVVRDFALRPYHRRGDRGAHCVEIETDGALLVDGCGNERGAALNVDAEDRAERTAAYEGREVDAADRCELPRGRRRPLCGRPSRLPRPSAVVAATERSAPQQPRQQ